MTTTPGYQRFFAELKRRKVFRTAAVYGATGFVVLQVAELLAEGLNLSPAVLQTATVLVLIGFPIVLVLAWALELTADGLKRTEDAATGEIEAIVAQPASKRWPAGLLALAGVVTLVAGAWYVGRTTAPGGVAAAGESASPTAAASNASGDGAQAATNAEVLNLAYADLADDERPSIAVLPFADMSREGDQEYFADGMTEELLNALAKIRELRVAGRTSSFAYKGQNKDLREIGRELGVRYLVEGSVRKQDNRLRITAQLVDANDNFHVWTETYDRTLDDVFAVQTEIAESVADALEVSLGIGAAGSLVTPTADLDAYDLYLTANARMRERGPGVIEAIRLFEAAVARDSGWAPAWAGLAQAHSLLPFYAEWETEAVRWATWEVSLDEAERAAKRALALDPGNSLAEVALGNVYRDRWEWDPSEEHFLRALEIDPDNGEAHQQYGEMLAQTGRLDEALRSARRGVELDPTSAIRNNVLGYIATYNGRYDEARAALEKALEQRPDFPSVYRNYMDIFVDEEDYDRAEAFMTSEAALRTIPGTERPSARADVERKLSDYFEALRNRDPDALYACCAADVIPRLAHPPLFVRLGDPDRALDLLLEQLKANPGFDGNSTNHLWVPEWEGLTDDPRYQEALRYTGLEDAEMRRDLPEN